MLKILPNITFGQTQNPQRKNVNAATTAVKFERSPKCDCLSFGGRTDFDLSLKYLEKAQNLTLRDNLFINPFPNFDFNVIPMNFCFAMKNSPSRHIIQKFPEGLDDCGSSRESVLTKLDKIANIIRLTMGSVHYKSFLICGKEIPTAYLGTGRRGYVHMLDTGKEKIAFKTFKAPNMIGHHGILGEAAMARQFAKENVSDATRLYMAAPESNTAWMATTFVDRRTQIHTDGISAEEFLRKHRLVLNDSENIAENYVLSAGRIPVLVDFGGITPKNSRETFALYGDLKEKYLPQTDMFSLLEDEGTRISILRDRIFKLSSTKAAPIPTKNLNSPEARLTEAYRDYIFDRDMSKSKFAEHLQAIDVIGEFKVLPRS